MLSSSIRTAARRTLQWSARGSTLCSRLTKSKLSPRSFSISKTISSKILPFTTKSTYRPNKKELAFGALIAALLAQSFFGSESDFYEYRFIAKEGIDPDDLASFYGSEQFMDIFCMVPIVGQIMMRGGYFDDDGVVHTFGFPGELLVSMAFTDEMNEKTDTTDWFNKRERFKNVFLGKKMWDQVSNFGFHTLPNGRIEVYHTGEYFVGWLPIISLGVKIGFQIQARLVAWATEHHLNHRAFINETDEEEELEELSRTNHMLYFIKYHFWNDLKVVLGIGKEKIENATFLALGSTDEVEKITLPIKRAKTMARVQESLEMDKGLVRKEDFESIPTDNAYRMAQKVAMRKHYTLRLVHRKTTIRDMSNRNVDGTKKVYIHEVKHPDVESNVEKKTEPVNEESSNIKDEIHESVDNPESNSVNEEGKTIDVVEASIENASLENPESISTNEEGKKLNVVESSVECESLDNPESNSVDEEEKKFDVVEPRVEKDEGEMSAEIKNLSNVNESETESVVLTEKQKVLEKHESNAMNEDAKENVVDPNVAKNITRKKNERNPEVEKKSNWSEDETKTDALSQVVKQLDLEPIVEVEVMESLHANASEFKEGNNKI